ncbi:MAG: hypothetical protein FWG90_05580 [Oscillospiraceae bacterium]|nr:hypothetical protein [Oscillospiraceae bacterium]
MATATARIRDYTQAEIEALSEKLYNPERDVNCPRCGNEIDYREIGNSTAVKCLTSGCIFGGLRGL